MSEENRAETEQVSDRHTLCAVLTALADLADMVERKLVKTETCLAAGHILNV